MPLTPSTLTRHELIGLRVTVTNALNADLVAITGRVVNETTQMLHIETAPDTVKQVPKRGTVFEFKLPDGEHVLVEGRRLVARPARRSETRGGTKWHSD